jgi:protein required for attachment to host cells
MKSVKTWILIADGARARVLLNEGPGRGIQVVEGLVFHGDHSATHDLVSDREGRSYSSHGPGRSAIEPHSDPHRELKKTFVHGLARMLARELEQHAYERLVIVAPPVALGDLRAAISDHVRSKVVSEVAHDLTKLPNDEIAVHLKGILVT